MTRRVNRSSSPSGCVVENHQRGARALAWRRSSRVGSIIFNAGWGRGSRTCSPRTACCTPRTSPAATTRSRARAHAPSVAAGAQNARPRRGTALGSRALQAAARADPVAPTKRGARLAPARRPGAAPRRGAAAAPTRATTRGARARRRLARRRARGRRRGAPPALGAGSCTARSARRLLGVGATPPDAAEQRRGHAQLAARVGRRSRARSALPPARGRHLGAHARARRRRCARRCARPARRCGDERCSMPRDSGRRRRRAWGAPPAAGARGRRDQRRGSPAERRRVRLRRRYGYGFADSRRRRSRHRPRRGLGAIVRAGPARRRLLRRLVGARSARRAAAPRP